MLFQNAELHNIVELIPDDKAGWLTARLPQDVRSTVNEQALATSTWPAGGEIRFNLQEGKSAKIVLSLKGASAQGTAVEVYQGCFRTKIEYITEKPTEITITHSQTQAELEKLSKEHSLAFDSRLTRLLLPSMQPIRIIGIEGPISPPTPSQTPRRYLAYGSSITRGGASYRTGGNYAYLTARHLKADLLNHGYGGGAFMEESLAKYLANRIQWDFASLEMGINVWTWDVEKYRQTVDTFIRTFTAVRPDTWIFCIDIFTFRPDLGLKHKDHKGFREALKEVVARINLPKVVHVDGREMMKDITGLSSDFVHPSDDGHAELAWNLSTFMRKTMADQ